MRTFMEAFETLVKRGDIIHMIEFLKCPNKKFTAFNRVSQKLKFFNDYNTKGIKYYYKIVECYTYKKLSII